MRLGRPLALTAAVVLAAGITSPAYADSVTPPAPGGGAPSFDLDDVSDHIDPNSSYTFTGKGCISKDMPGTVRVAIGDAQDNATLVGDVKANADGTWSLTVNMADAIKKSGGDAKTDPWYVFAQCQHYNGPQSQVEEESFYLTKADGKVHTESDSEHKVTMLKATGTGFNPGDQLTFMLTPSDEQGKVADDAAGITLASGTVGADGSYELMLPVPSNVPDGYFVISLKAGSGESGTFKAVYKGMNGQLYYVKGLDDASGNGGADMDKDDDKDKGAQQQQPPAKNVADKQPAKPATQKELAKTGVAAPAVALLALGMAGSGAVALKRRKA